MRPPLINVQKLGPVIGLAIALTVGFLAIRHPSVLGIIFLFGIAAFLIGAVLLAWFGKLSDGFSDQRKEPVPIPMLRGKLCAIRSVGYTRDKRKDEFDTAIANVLSLDATALKEAEGYVFQYYKDHEEDWKSYDDEFKPIRSPSDVWKHVQFGSELRVFRRRDGDQGIYISIECGCDWEPEHGMEIVFKEGRKLVKVGPDDGDPFGDESLENAIYKA